MCQGKNQKWHLKPWQTDLLCILLVKKWRQVSGTHGFLLYTDVFAFDILIFKPYFFMIDYFHCFSCNPIFLVLMNIVNFIHLKLKLTRSQFKLYPATQWLNISSTEKWKHLPYIIIILSWKIVSVNWKKIDPWIFKKSFATSKMPL